MRALGFILFFTALLLLGSIGVKAQTVIPTGAVNQTTVQRGGYGADTLFVIPIRDTFCNNFLTLRCRGRITQQPSTNNIYYHDGTKWRGIGGGADSSIFVTLTYLNNVLDGYIQWGDTLNIIATKSDIPQQFDSTYLSQRIDSIVGVLDEYVKYTDTALMLVPYLRKSDTTAMLVPYLRKVDTASLSARIDARVKYSDTATLIQTRYRADSMNATKWTVGGNTLAGNGSIGLINSGALNFITNNITRGTLGAAGGWTFGSSTSTVETQLTIDNDQTNTFSMGIGRGGSITANRPFIILGATSIFGGGSSMGMDITFGEALALRPNSTSAVIYNALSSATTLLPVTYTSYFGGGARNPTSGDYSILRFVDNSSNGYWGPSSGTARDFFINDNRRFNLPGGSTANGIHSTVFVNPNLINLGSSDFYAFRTLHNAGRAYSYEGTAIGVMLGRALFGTSVDPLTEQVYISGTLGITQTPASNPATDSLLVKINGSQRVGRIAPITTLITEQQAGFTSSTTNATPATIHTIPLTTSGQVLVVDIDLAWKSGTSIGRGRKTVTYINNSGTLAILGSVVDIVTTMTQPAVSGSSFTITTSGTNVIVQATGLAATNISWSGVAKYKYHF